jgi:O-antigen ligase
MLAFVLPTVFAMLMLGKLRQLLVALVAALVVLCVAYAVETETSYSRKESLTDNRPLTAHQIVDNVASIYGQSGEDTQGTKRWRLDWWDIIIKDTVFGPHFWTGRGFGLNLADADGFQDRADPDTTPLLRNPHNVQMTILARAGVPGVALWATILAAWFGMVMHAMGTARRRGQAEWAGLFLFIGCYVLSIIIDASFDVALEGPMLGVWFWCLIGFGIGSAMVYRCQLDEVSRQ